MAKSTSLRRAILDIGVERECLYTDFGNILVDGLDELPGEQKDVGTTQNASKIRSVLDSALDGFRGDRGSFKQIERGFKR
jgi:hypothetical protein